MSLTCGLTHWPAFTWLRWNSRQFLGFTETFFSNSEWVSEWVSEWGSTQNVLMIVLHWSKQISRNCAHLLPNTRSTHTVKIFFSLMRVCRFGVDPQWNLWRHVKPKSSESRAECWRTFTAAKISLCAIPHRVSWVCVTRRARPWKFSFWRELETGYSDRTKLDDEGLDIPCIGE